MKNYLRSALSVTFMAVVLGCSPRVARIDATSEDSFKASTETVIASLPPGKQEELKTAILSLGMSYALEIGFDKAKSPKGIAGFRKTIDGKSADEIIALAKSKTSTAANAK